jgi:putative transcriptional regulator
LEQLEIEPRSPAAEGLPVYLGGPVQTDRGFVIHCGPQSFESTLQVTPDLRITTSRDVLEAIAEGSGPAQSLVALGYAGWGSGQLEDEMGNNAWLSGPADDRIIFRLPSSERWLAAAQLLGIDINLLSSEAGHA